MLGFGWRSLVDVEFEGELGWRCRLLRWVCAKAVCASWSRDVRALQGEFVFVYFVGSGLLEKVRW